MIQHLEWKRFRVEAVRCLWHKNRGTTDRADRSAVLEWRQVDVVVVVVGGDLRLPSTRRRRLRRTVFNGDSRRVETTPAIDRAFDDGQY